LAQKCQSEESIDSDKESIETALLVHRLFLTEGEPHHSQRDNFDDVVTEQFDE
jgi:hypothetical protein